MERQTRDPRSPAAADLHALMDVALPIFVLVDPMLGEPLFRIADAVGDTRAARALGWRRDVTVVSLNKCISLPPDQHPYLVALSGLDDPLLQETLTLAQAERSAAQADGLDGNGGSAHRIAGWLQSSLHVEQLAEQLSRMLRAHTAAVSSAKYLRQVDRRVLALLRHVAGDARVAAQFGRLHSWTYLSVTGELETVLSGSENSVALYLSSDEWCRMAHCELIQRTIAQWLGELARDGRSMPPTPAGAILAHATAAVDGANAAARRWPYRFSAPADLTTWAALSMLHPGLGSSAAVTRLMASAGDPGAAPDPLRYLHTELRALVDANPLRDDEPRREHINSPHYTLQD